MAEKKRYWLKLEKDFLDSKYIKIIKGTPNGTDYHSHLAHTGDNS